MRGGTWLRVDAGNSRARKDRVQGSGSWDARQHRSHGNRDHQEPAVDRERTLPPCFATREGHHGRRT